MKAASTERRDYISYPTNRVVGTVGDDGKAKTAIDALLRAGFAREDIDILHDEKDLKRLDPTGAEHGFFAQFQRTLIRALDLEEFKHLTHHVEDVRAGRFVIMVLAKRRAQRIVAADILHRMGPTSWSSTADGRARTFPPPPSDRRKRSRHCSPRRGTTATPMRSPRCSMRMPNS